MDSMSLNPCSGSISISVHASSYILLKDTKLKTTKQLLRSEITFNELNKEL